MYNTIVNLNAVSYNNVMSSSSSGRLYLPVQPSMVKYTQLSHIHGTAAKPGQKAVSIDKIHILNTLIDQLVSMKKDGFNAEQDITALTDSQKDALIQNYQEQIHTTVAAASQANYGLAGLVPEAGALFTVSA